MNIEIKKVKLSEIKINPQNPRIIHDEQYKKLLASLREFPDMLEIREIVVDENMVILGGNMRYRALQELKEKETQVKIVKGLSEEKKREFIIKDNIELGVFDWDKLANEWSDKPLEKWGVYDPFSTDNENKNKDLCYKLENKYEIVIEAKDETEQNDIYNSLKDKYKCRLLIL